MVINKAHQNTSDEVANITNKIYNNYIKIITVLVRHHLRPQMCQCSFKPTRSAHTRTVCVFELLAVGEHYRSLSVYMVSPVHHPLHTSLFHGAKISEFLS